ncbi:MAG: tryptophan synthase subunit alpha, partial [Bacilli bacterium]
QNVFEIVQKARAAGCSIPVILMTYANPILAYGEASFFAECEKSGVDGIIVPDVPYEETDRFEEAANQHNVAIIQLVTLTSGEKRLAQIIGGARGFLYAVTITGVTGGSATFTDELYGLLERARGFGDVPICAGFGIRSAEQVQDLLPYVDGVIVGSALIEMIGNGEWGKVEELIGAVKG